MPQDNWQGPPRRLFPESALGLLALLGLVALVTQARAESQTCPPTVIQRNRHSTVFLTATVTHKSTGRQEDRTGTGFIVSSDGFMLTAAHVVTDPDADRVEIAGAIGSRYARPTPVHLIRATDQDVALLQFADSSQRYSAVELGTRSDVVGLGTHVCAGGFPNEEDYLAFDGAVSGTGWEGGLWLTQMPSNLGDSGAPVFLPSGRVVAIKEGERVGLQSVNALIPLRLARDLLQMALDQPQVVVETTGLPVLPLVVLMDSHLQGVVYCCDTFARGGSNADDIAALLSPLPVAIASVGTYLGWNNDDQVLGLNPALVVIHASAFYEETKEIDTNLRLLSFLDTMKRSRAKILVYSRGLRNESDAALRRRWDNVISKVDELGARAELFVIPTKAACFHDSAVSRPFVDKIRQMLQLPAAEH